MLQRIGLHQPENLYLQLQTCILHRALFFCSCVNGKQFHSGNIHFAASNCLPFLFVAAVERLNWGVGATFSFAPAPAVCYEICSHETLDWESEASLEAKRTRGTFVVANFDIVASKWPPVFQATKVKRTFPATKSFENQLALCGDRHWQLQLSHCGSDGQPWKAPFPFLHEVCKRACSINARG